MRNNNKRQLTHKNGQGKNNAFVCRVCRKMHPLKRCYRFLNMNTTERGDAVRNYGYCSNCLAHSHSQGSCFTKSGCRYCHRQHHSLLHIHPRLQQSSSKTCSTSLNHPPSRECKFSSSTVQRSTAKANPKSEHISTTNASVSSSVTSLTAILKQNAISLLPTALVKISAKDGKHYVRCLLDSASRMSIISKKIVDKLGLTTLELDDEIIAPVTLWSRADTTFKLEATLRVQNRISITTPSQSLPESGKKNFQNFVLADQHFYKASSVDIILGVDLYSRIITDGIFVRAGLPTAQNTKFGLILYGSFST